MTESNLVLGVDQKLSEPGNFDPAAADRTSPLPEPARPQTRFRTETIGDCTLILGDCREVLPTLGRVDACVTDPPYGLGSNVGSGLRKKSGKSRTGKSAYLSELWSDTAEYVRQAVVPAIELCLEMADRTALTPGIRCLSAYPSPAHIGSFQYPGSTVMSCWGPVLWQPILYYGRDPHQGRLVPDSRPGCNDIDLDTDHPCPKPLKQWTWLVQRATSPGKTCLDPFMGSGTTGVVCAQHGRSFIGIEIEPRYFDVACRRIEEAYKQPRLFDEPTAKPVQTSFLDASRPAQTAASNPGLTQC